MNNDSHNNLPNPDVYEKEYEFWPWGELIYYVEKWLTLNASPNSIIIDYMCGTGYLLNKVAELRPDLKVAGCSITEKFINHAKKYYLNINVQLKDVLLYKPHSTPDIIIATGGIHHLDYQKQIKFIEKVAFELKSGGTFIIGEEILRDFDSSIQRKKSVLELSSNLIAYILEKNAPDEIIQAALNLLEVDIFQKGEYKLSLNYLSGILEKNFIIEEIVHIWPDTSDPFGDYVFLCKRR